MFSWKLNIGTNIILRASSVRFGLHEGCFFLRCVQEMEGYQAMDADLWGPWRWALKPPVRLASDWRASWDDWTNGEGRGLVKGHTGSVRVTQAYLAVQRASRFRAGPDFLMARRTTVFVLHLCFLLVSFLIAVDSRSDHSYMPSRLDFAQFFIFPQNVCEHFFILLTGGQLLAWPRQHGIRLLANQQSEWLQYDQLWWWVSSLIL